MQVVTLKLLMGRNKVSIDKAMALEVHYLLITIFTVSVFIIAFLCKNNLHHQDQTHMSSVHGYDSVDGSSISPYTPPGPDFSGSVTLSGLVTLCLAQKNFPRKLSKLLLPVSASPVFPHTTNATGLCS
jgi:hypothetical protein